ncbi:MAG TPA: hypothetical protein VJT15_10135 [Pyrinomonadaceae bacterium]|nr:hypothetical protein [Pyrinomonadaceae bacterium]
MVADVTTCLKDMGRKSLFGSPMLDSMAKGDLLKVLTRVKAEDLIPGAVGNFQTVLAGIQELKQEIGKIETNLLNGEASAQFAAMQGSIMPILHDLQALASRGTIDPAVFFGDLYKLRQLKAADVLNILGQVQQGVSKDLSAAKTDLDESEKALAAALQTNDQKRIGPAEDREAKDKGKLEALQAVDSGLKTIANKIASLSTSFDAAFAPLFARLEQVEVWYDTVMQGFEERYTRHMRTVGIVISIVIVIILNANFFSIYRAIKSDPVKTALIVEQGEKLINTPEQQNTPEATGSPAPVTTPAPSPSSSIAPAASPSPAPTESPVTIADVRADIQQVEDLTRIYESFGIQPLSRQQIGNFFAGGWRWRDLNETILGWGIMVMLLSAGAPFWQDTLESLFGVKNLLRKKSDTKNVEEGKGGQPKP